LAEQHDPQGGDASGGSDDSRYLGPFGDQPQPGPSFAPQPLPGRPTGVVPPVPVAPPVPAPVRRERQSPRPAAVIGIAALTALLIGGGAGYGGARLAERSDQAGSPAATAPTTQNVPADDPTAEPSPTSAPRGGSSFDAVAVAKKVLPSTVMIKVGRGTGSGFVLDPKGRIVTNNHVVAGAADGAAIRVIFADGRRQKAKLIGRSPSYDIAVIKVKPTRSLHPVEVGDSARTQVGEPVMAIGAPLGLPGTVTQGIVSARHRPVVVNASSDADSPSAYIDAIQTDAPINPGNSGGPLVDGRARIIGVNSAILTMGSAHGGQTGNIGLGFAIPINQATAIGALLIKNGRATYPVIGANVEVGSGGVELTSVEGSGPAARAGLRRGDLITRIDGTKIIAVEELIVTIRTRRPGQKVVLDYERGSRRKQAEVTLGRKVG
jgi:putative serine protease PepD